MPCFLRVLEIWLIMCGIIYGYFIIIDLNFLILEQVKNVHFSDMIILMIHTTMIWKAMEWYVQLLTFFQQSLPKRLECSFLLGFLLTKFFFCGAKNGILFLYVFLISLVNISFYFWKASQHFGDILSQFVGSLASVVDILELPVHLRRACIAHRGVLTSLYEYIPRMRKSESE